MGIYKKTQSLPRSLPPRPLPGGLQQPRWLPDVKYIVMTILRVTGITQIFSFAFFYLIGVDSQSLHIQALGNSLYLCK